MVTPDVKRNAVAHVCAQHGVSQRLACEVLSVDWSSMRYSSVRPDDASIREAMKRVASERRREPRFKNAIAHSVKTTECALIGFAKANPNTGSA